MSKSKVKKQRCSDCHRRKPATLKYFNIRTKIGNRLKLQCKECKKKYNVIRYQENRETHNVKKPYKKRKPILVILSDKQRARAAEFMRRIDRRDMALAMLRAERNMMKAVKGYRPMGTRPLHE